MFILQMTLAGIVFLFSVLVTWQTLEEDTNPHVQARKLLVSAILLATVAYLVK